MLPTSFEQFESTEEEIGSALGNLKTSYWEAQGANIASAWDFNPTSSLFRVFDQVEAYQESNESYFVAILNDRIVGGAGIKHLSGSDENICELQKMYILPEARNKKVGKELILKCLDYAKKSNYEQCYLETFPQMQSAINLYIKNGFTQNNQALGNTSH